jgi:hypothetical protein
MKQKEINMNREITECCMDNISFIFHHIIQYDHLVCPECNTRWDITYDGRDD